MERDSMNLDYISARGERLPLANNSLFVLTNVDGHTSAAASIASSVMSGADGDVVNNVQANPRTIVLDLRIRSGVDVEAAKRAVLKVVKIKQRSTLEWTQNNRTVSITGVVESIDMPRWNDAVTMQITMYCDQPFWEDVDYIVQQISEAIDLHYFTDGATDMLYFPAEGIPFGEYDTLRTKECYNDGDVSVGLEISIVALDTVTNPIIYDGNGNFFGLGYAATPKSGMLRDYAPTTTNFVMEAGDHVVITTHKGNKTVKLNGEVIFRHIKPQSTWLQLAAGNNQFTINSDDDSLTNMTFSLIYKQRYV
jgi:hypothetical protein